MPTRDGYPTDEELTRIREWPGDDPRGWLAFIKLCWWAADWGWSEEYEPRWATTYHISTGGWSGNEEIIRAMRENTNLLWGQVWESVRRGGHYVFAVPEAIVSAEKKALGPIEDNEALFGTHIKEAMQSIKAMAHATRKWLLGR